MRALFLSLLLLAPLPVLAEAPRVVASILPIHALAARIMQGVGQPELLLPASASPHDFSLRPSQRRLLQRADLVLWAGPELEGFLPRVLRALPARVHSLALLDACCPAPADRHHAHGRDPHFWLDPRASVRAAAAITEALAERDPAHAASYRANLAAFRREAAALEQELRQRLAPLRGRRLVTWHDAYSRFAERFGLTVVDSVTLDAHRPPGARHLRALRRAIAEGRVDCLYLEAQFTPRLLDALTEAGPVAVGRLDPLGSGLTPGADAWPRLLNRLADGFLSCLGPPSQAPARPQHQPPDQHQQQQGHEHRR